MEEERDLQELVEVPEDLVVEQITLIPVLLD
jgi:hypothetical protein